MKRNIYVGVLMLILSAFTALFVSGCQSKSGDARPGDEVNSNMSAQQKANLTDRKQRDNQ